MIDISSLSQALATLDEALAALARAPEDKFIRDACIQRFGYCYELSHDILRRYLELTEPDKPNQFSFPSLIRLGYERGLLHSSWDEWNNFQMAHEKKNYTYEVAIANFVLSTLPAFVAEANFMCVEMERRREYVYAACA